MGFPAANEAVEEGAEPDCGAGDHRADEKTVRTRLRPPAMKLLPRQWPDWRVKGARPTSAAICRRLRVPEFGQLGDQRAGDDRSDAGHRGEQVLLVAPSRRAAHAVVDIAVEARQLLLEALTQAGDALLETRL